MASEHPLIGRRQILISAIEDLTATAVDQQKRRLDPEPWLTEATRLVFRLQRLQEEIEKHDLD